MPFGDLGLEGILVDVGHPIFIKKKGNYLTNVTIKTEQDALMTVTIQSKITEEYLGATMVLSETYFKGK